MSEKWPSAEEVQATFSNYATQPKVRIYLEQFATILRQMEAAGSPVTDELDVGRAGLFEYRKTSRHFEQLAGAIEARTKERCANEVPTNWTDPLLTGPKAVIKDLDNRQIEALLRGIQDRIRALPRASERRIRGERRFRSMDPVDGRYAKDRRIAKQPRRQS